MVVDIQPRAMGADVRPVTAVDARPVTVVDALLVMAAATRRRAVMAAVRRMAEGRTEVVAEDMGGNIALEFFPA